jgi:16S rRNA (uracil1498-N3)-methyltransferase
VAGHRFFLKGAIPESGALPLSESDLHHLRDVLRLDVGDTIVAVGDDGSSAVVRLTAVTPASAAATVIERLPASVVPRVVLVQGLAKGEKMDTVIRQATELGIERIVPLSTSRSVVRLDPAKAAVRAARWRRVAAEAAKQSQRTSVPEIAELTDILGLKAALAGVACTLVAWEDADGAGGIGETLADAGIAPDAPVAIVVGPEGGFSAEEVATLVAAGAKVVSLGPTVLRTETAGVVAAALVLYERGGLGRDVSRG